MNGAVIEKYKAFIIYLTKGAFYKSLIAFVKSADFFKKTLLKLLTNGLHLW